MHMIYVYTYAWTCSCNRNGEDFDEVDRQKIEGNHLQEEWSAVKGMITVGERVEVAWGKSKKNYAVVLNIGGECHSQDVSQQDAIAHSKAIPPHSRVSVFRSKTLAQKTNYLHLKWYPQLC